AREVAAISTAPPTANCEHARAAAQVARSPAISARVPCRTAPLSANRVCPRGAGPDRPAGPCTSAGDLRGPPCARAALRGRALGAARGTRSSAGSLRHGRHSSHPLEGPALAEVLEPRPALGPASDLDLLIAREVDRMSHDLGDRRALLVLRRRLRGNQVSLSRDPSGPPGADPEHGD